MEGAGGKGRGKKTWQKCVKEDINKWDLEDVMRRIARSGGTTFLGNVQPALALKNGR